MGFFNFLERLLVFESDESDSVGSLFTEEKPVQFAQVALNNGGTCGNCLWSLFCLLLGAT